jgi:type IV pilus assembly protein PilV
MMPQRSLNRRAGRRARGFTLVEVLAALLIISIGLLGIAKIQALAYSNTGTASMRSLAALEAAGLASAMRANQAYWATNLAAFTSTLTVTVNGAAVTASDATLSADLGSVNLSSTCQGASTSTCTASALLAAYDLTWWASGLNGVIPGSTASITCPPATSGPVSCTIQVNWTEHTVGLNTNSAGNQMGGAAASYYLVVEP